MLLVLENSLTFMHMETNSCNFSRQAAVKNNYLAVCTVYFLSRVGLGDNIQSPWNFFLFSFRSIRDGKIVACNPWIAAKLQGLSMAMYTQVS